MPLKSTALLGVRIDRLLMWRNAKPARQWPSALLTPTPKWSENWKLLPFRRLPMLDSLR